VDAGFAVDTAVLIAGVLLAVGIVGSGLAARYRIPSLLLFIALGMLVADDGLAIIRFDDAALAQNIAAVALAVILFEGGLTTDPAAFRRVGAPAGLLATVGVAITAAVVALGANVVFSMPWTTALLLGAVVASTDAAAVFAALRGESLPSRIRETLQLESGLNDPVAVMLTVGMVEVWRAEVSADDWVVFIGTQLFVGAAAGLALGFGARWLILRFDAPARTAFDVLTVAIAALAYGAAATIGGSGFLAVYLTGVVLAGARRPVRGLVPFHAGLASTAQALLFLILGLLVFPSRLVDDLGEAAVLTLVLVFVARPLAVHAVLPWFGVPHRDRLLVSWAGLRGAVPVVLATIPLTAGHPDGGLVFDLAFVVSVVSVALQAPTVAPLARRLGIRDDAPPSVIAELVPIADLDADLVEVDLPPDASVAGSTLAARPLPGPARVAVVQRAERTFVPDGATTLLGGDRLLVVFPYGCDLADLERWAGGEPPTH
jgi:cell volume regulation protein A